MSIELTRKQSMCEVSGVPVYGKVCFTPGSKDSLNSPDAMEFPRQFGGFLQSLGHAIVARVAFYEDNEKTGSGLDGSDEYQKTGTAHIRYYDGKGWRSAFMELPDEKASFGLVIAGYINHAKGKELVAPRSEPLVAKLIGLAEEAGRVRPVFKESLLRLSTKQNRGRSEYGSNLDVIACVGSAEIAELNASYSQRRKRDYGWLSNRFTASEVESELKGREDQALIRLVARGGEFCHKIGNIVANEDIGIVVDDTFVFTGGRARGVTEEQK